MKHYKITCIHKDKHCSQNPTDHDCTFDEIVEARNETDAIMKLHKQAGMHMNMQHNVLPEIWSIEQIKEGTTREGAFYTEV